MPPTIRIALAQERDEGLSSALGALAHSTTVARFSSLIDGFPGIVAFAPDLLLLCGGEDLEELGALRALAQAVPGCALALVTPRDRELAIAPLADRIGARVLLTPFLPADLATLLAAVAVSPARPPLDAYLDLLRGVADEINNPLLAAAGHLQLAECLLDPAVDAAVLEQLRAARAAQDRIARSLARIATLSRARSLRHPLPAIGFRKVVRRALRALDPRQRERFSVRRLPAARVQADCTLLETAVAALLSTAAELVGPDGSVRVDLEHRDGTVVLRLRLPPSAAEAWYLPQAFLPYHVARVLRGTPRGLDLFLVQSIAHGHGGVAAACRRRAGDLELTLELPVQPA